LCLCPRLLGSDCSQSSANSHLASDNGLNDEVSRPEKPRPIGITENHSKPEAVFSLKVEMSSMASSGPKQQADVTHLYRPVTFMV
jgi:hypothetical protein